MRPKIHAFDGETGAGKTTLSKKLAKELKAYRINHDELLAISYSQEQLAKEHAACCDRANRLAWKIVERVAALGIDIVMEGWGSRELRDQIRGKAKELGLDLEFYLVTCPQEERLKRIRKRNENSGDDAPHITDEDFFRMEEIEDVFGENEVFTVIKNDQHNQAVVTTPGAAALSVVTP